MKFIDLFAGIGGFRLGLERCNSNKRTDEESESSKPDKDVRLRERKTIQEVSWSGWRNGNLDKGERSILPTNIGRFRSVYSNEWDKYASQIYKKHFKECDTRDVTTIGTDEIPDHDLLCAGFPCQSFSIAGKRKGFGDTRGTLFFDIARILADKRPGHLLLENVKGLLSHDGGKTFSTIIGVLTDLGYLVEWQVLNSKNFGVPQNRERVFIIGHLGGGCGPKIFPIGQDDKVSDRESNTDKRRTQAEVSGTLKGSEMKADHTYIKETQKLSDAMRVRETSGVSSTLKSLGGGMGAKTGLYATGTRIRRLTPTECERLQGFPDGWTEGISDTQRYKTLGNAVTVNVVEELGKRLCKNH